MTYSIIILQSRATLTSTVASARKENHMDEPMTDYQFKTLLKMILEILDTSKDIAEAREKVKNLLEDEKN